MHDTHRCKTCGKTFHRCAMKVHKKYNPSHKIIKIKKSLLRRLREIPKDIRDIVEFTP